MNVFKVGDRVRSLKTQCTAIQKGEVYTITEMRDSTSFWTKEFSGWIGALHFELVTEPVKFEVGDMVRLMSMVHCVPAGTKTTVSQIEETGVRLKGWSGIFPYDKLEPVAEPAPMPAATPPPPAPQFRVGDTVETMSNQHGRTKGTQCVVKRVDAERITVDDGGCFLHKTAAIYFRIVVAPKSSFNVGDMLRYNGNGSVITVSRVDGDKVWIGMNSGPDTAVYLRDNYTVIGRLPPISDASVKAQPVYKYGDVYASSTAPDQFFVINKTGYARLHYKQHLMQQADTLIQGLSDKAVNKKIGAWLGNVFNGFDCSDTDKTAPSEGGSMKKEESMKDFKKGDRVYRLGDGWSKACHGEEGCVLGVNVSGSLQVQMDNGHTTPNGSSAKFALVTPRNTIGTQESTMSTFAITIEKQTVINGRVITDETTDEALYQYINDAEFTIEKLNKMKAQPKSLKAKVKALEDGITGIVAICDARTAA